MTDSRTLKSAAKWPFKQVADWGSSAWHVLTDYHARDFLPPGIVDAWDWLKAQFPRAFGFGTPAEQLSASVVLAVAAIFTSLFTGGITIAVVFVFFVTFVIGFVRLWSPANRLWPWGGSRYGSGNMKR